LESVWLLLLFQLLACVRNFVLNKLRERTHQYLLGNIHDARGFPDIDLTLDAVGIFLYAGYYVVNRIGLFYRIVLCVLHEERRLETDKIGGVGRKIFGEFGLGVLFCEAIRILAVGESADADVHSLFENEVDSADGRTESGRVAVKKHRYVFGQAVYEADLIGRERGSG